MKPSSPSPLLCVPEEKPRLEAANALEQLSYLEYFITRGSRAIRKADVLQLQQLAVAGIFPCGGKLRTALYSVTVPDSRHQPPPAVSVEGHLDELLDVLNDTKRPALDRAAIALWRFNWIHPFPGGNGRTARALAYLVLCIDNERMLPGVPTIPALIAQRRDGYIDALRAVDERARRLESQSLHDVLSDEASLEPMRAYMRRVVNLQMTFGLSAELFRSSSPGTRFFGVALHLLASLADSLEHRRR